MQIVFNIMLCGDGGWLLVCGYGVDVWCGMNECEIICAGRGAVVV